MKTRIVRIGNSRGLRIPKPLLEQAGLDGEVEIQLRKNSLVIKPLEKPRAGWAESFREMTRRGDDRLPGGPDHVVNQFDKDEWEW